MQVYAIGRLTLHPHRELLDGGAPVTIGGRALDLLSALAGANGEVVSKDALFDGVWKSAIVEENALQAQVSAARKALGSESRRLVTVHGRGYRLELDGDCAEQVRSPASDRPRSDLIPPLPSASAGEATGEQPQTTDLDHAPPGLRQRPWTRRAAAGTLLLAGTAAAAGLALWPRSSRHVHDPRALELYRRGQLVRRGELEDTGEAMALYRQAVAIDPDFAAGWAELALAQRDLRTPGTTPFTDPRLVRSAANRALRLDPGNAQAQLALIQLYPPFRRWLAQEGRLRAFTEGHPNVASGQIFLAMLLHDVGRVETALVHAARATEIDPQSLRGWFMFAVSLSGAGRYTESDIAFGEGRRRWPQSRLLWFGRYETLLENRRYADAAAFVQDRSRRPQVVTDELAQRLILLAEAFVSERSRAVAIRRCREAPARGQIDNFATTAQVMAWLGLTDMMFEAAEAYFFGGSFNGERIAAPSPLDPRPSYMLFGPSLVPLRADPRWGALLERTGLEDYWRKSGTRPDFRSG